MNFKPGMEREYAEYLAENSKDGYSLSAVRYGERWAGMMEAAIAKGATVAEAAAATEMQADTEGITGFQYGCVVKALAHFWTHGEELRQWHNHKYNYEGSGTVNPAILTFGE